MPAKTQALLEQILGAKSKVAVLRVLLQSKLGHSGRTIVNLTGSGRFSVQKTLATLEHIGLVEVERGSIENRYRLNREHYLVANGLESLFEGERHMVNQLTQDLRTLLEGKVLAAGLFGSFARGIPQANSDIDVMVIVKSSREQEQISHLLIDSEVALTRKYGWPVQAVIFEHKRLLNPRTNGPQLLDEAAKDWQHITGLKPAELKKLDQAPPKSKASP